MGKHWNHKPKKKYRSKEKEENFETKHHCINVSWWGRETKENLFEVLSIPHKYIHYLYGNKLPHEIMKTNLKTIYKPFSDELKADLYAVLAKHKWKEYKERAYKWDKPKNWPDPWHL